MSQRFMVAVLAVAGTFAAAIESSHLVRTSGESRRIRSALDDLTAAVEAEGGTLEVRELTEEEMEAARAAGDQMQRELVDSVLADPRLAKVVEIVDRSVSVDDLVKQAVADALAGLDAKIAEAVAGAVASAASAPPPAADAADADAPPAARERRSRGGSAEAPADA